MLHRTIAAVRDDMASMSFNTAIARLIEMQQPPDAGGAQRDGAAPREVVLPLVLHGRAAGAAHRGGALGASRPHRHAHVRSRSRSPIRTWLVDDTVEVPVQVNGKVRTRITVPAGADAAAHESVARADERIAALLDGKEVRKVIVVPGRTVNFVLV